MISPSPLRRSGFPLLLGSIVIGLISAKMADGSLTGTTYDREGWREAVGQAEVVVYWLAACTMAGFGVLADRLRRKSLLVATHLLGAGLIASAAAAWYLDVLTLPHLIVVTAGLALLSDLLFVAQEAYLPNVLGRHGLVRANALLMIATFLATAAGAMALQLSLRLTLLACVLTSLVAALLVGRIRMTEEPRQPWPGIWRSLGEGVRFTATHWGLRAIVCFLLISGFFSPVTDAWRGSTIMGGDVTAKIVGLSTMAGFAIGLVAAVSLAPRLGAFRTAWVGLAVTLPISLLALVPEVLLPGWFDPGGTLLYVVTATAHTAGQMVAAVALLSYRQEVVPDRLLGRTAGLLGAVVALAGLAGAYAADVLPHWTGPAGMLVAAVPLFLARRQASELSRATAPPEDGEPPSEGPEPPGDDEPSRAAKPPR